MDSMDSLNTVRLTTVGSEQLERIFQQELQCWEKELFWDYQPAISLIKKYVSSRSLPGWAVTNDKGDLFGYAYYVVNHPVGYIGNIYVRSECATAATYALLLDKILYSLSSSSRVQRIESQLFAFNCDLAPLFKSHDFVAAERHFLSLSLDQLEVDHGKANALKDFRISRWKKKFLQPAAEVIHSSYQQSPDRLLCYDYQSVEGCHRFLLNLIRHPSCGIFTPETSWIALDTRGELCAVLLTSRISPGTGMIPQISVRYDCQGMGIGSVMLRRYFREARKSGLDKITLSVSDANPRAYQLYLRFGFHKQKGFHAFVREGNGESS
ncbi:MAG: GNAT family N-acetyltransferase [Acidobacteriota bacterium]